MRTLEGLLLILDEETAEVTWSRAQELMHEQDYFLRRMRRYDPEKMPAGVRRRLALLIGDRNSNLEKLRKLCNLDPVPARLPAARDART